MEIYMLRFVSNKLPRPCSHRRGVGVPTSGLSGTVLGAASTVPSVEYLDDTLVWIVRAHGLTAVTIGWRKIPRHAKVDVRLAVDVARPTDRTGATDSRGSAARTTLRIIMELIVGVVGNRATGREGRTLAQEITASPGGGRDPGHQNWTLKFGRQKVQKWYFIERKNSKIEKKKKLKFKDLT